MTSLHRLLNPRTIAVIGGKECARVVEQCDKLGFGGTIWPIHPTRKAMHGRPCLRSLAELPEPPDAAYVAVNRERSIDMVRQLAAMGAGGAVCYAAGFAEADGENEGSAELQNKLLGAAGEMPIIGPNCYGLINALNGVALWPDQHGAVRCDSGVAIITQSSNIAINLTMQKRGLPIAMVMTVGNQAQIGLSELGLALIEDERITALGLHIEGLDDVAAFERLAMRARELKKPIVAIKVGKSEQAQAAALTHTASLAGSDVAHDALFKRLGIARVHAVDTFLETLKLLHCGGPLAGRDILSMSCSGGEASLMADAAENSGLVYRPYTPNQSAAVKIELGDIVTVANPLDYNTFIWGDWLAMTRMFEAALAPDFDISLLVMDFPRKDRCDPDDWNNATQSFVKAAQTSGTRAAVVASLSETMPEDMAAMLMAEGIAPLCGLDTAIVAAEAAFMIGEKWRRSPPAPLLPTSHPRCCGDYKAGGGKVTTLSEHKSKRELAITGLVVPKGVVIDESTDLGTTLQNLHFPLALKVLGIDHKTEIDGVRLNLTTQTDVANAITELTPLTSSFLLEEMAARPLAELLVGVTRDPVVGMMLTIGAGGVLTELLADTATMLLPATETDIRDALASLKIGKLLDGYRNSDAADIDALVANIICIANYACANADSLEELDVNPLFATQFGSVAVDALIVKRKTT